MSEVTTARIGVLLVAIGLLGCADPCEIVKSNELCDTLPSGATGCWCDYWMTCDDGHEYMFGISETHVPPLSRVGRDYMCKRLTEIPGYEGNFYVDGGDGPTCDDSAETIRDWINDQPWCPWDAPL